MSELHQALLEVQKNMPELQKDSINPHFRNTYISLNSLMESILPLLNKHGLLLLQEPCFWAEKSALKTTLIHVETGEAVSSRMPLILDKENSQGLGSAITYGRRYALMSILGLVADEDDDGEEASRDTNTSSGRSGHNRTSPTF